MNPFRLAWWRSHRTSAVRVAPTYSSRASEKRTIHLRLKLSAPHKMGFAFEEHHLRGCSCGLKRRVRMEPSQELVDHQVWILKTNPVLMCLSCRQQGSTCTFVDDLQTIGKGRPLVAHLRACPDAWQDSELGLGNASSAVCAPNSKIHKASTERDSRERHIRKKKCALPIPCSIFAEPSHFG